MYRDVVIYMPKNTETAEMAVCSKDTVNKYYNPFLLHSVVPSNLIAQSAERCP